MLHSQVLKPDEQARVPGITLLVASDVRFVRESLAEILARDSALQLLGSCADTQQAPRMCHDLHPDMVLLDAGARDGTAAVRRLREVRAGLRVVVFAMIETVETVMLWAEAGVDGYIPSSAAANDLCALVREIHAGRQSCATPVAAALLRRVATKTSAPPHTDGPQALTPRELQVVRLISNGLSNKEIARRLDIGLATTKSHVHNALSKLNVQRRGQVAPWMQSGSPSSRLPHDVG